MYMSKGKVGAIVFAAIILCVVIGFFVCSETIPTGHVGVVYNLNGGVDGEVLNQGFKLVAPTKRVTLYPISLEQSYLTADKKGDSYADESFTIPTADGKTVRVELEFSYKFDAERITETFKLFRGQSGETVKNTFIKPKIAAWSQEVSAAYPVTDIFGDKRTEINAELDRHLKEKFNPYGIIIDTVNFTNITVDDETAAAIQKKVNAQQVLELAKIESETALIQANKEREVAIIAAEKKQIEAEADAEANRKIAESLTPTLIEKLKYEKWNGELPQIQGASTPIVNLAE